MIEARSSARPAWLGGGAIFLAVLTLVGAVWTFRPTSDEPPLPPMAGTSDLSRFRADAWFLPAEELLGFVEIPAGPFLMGATRVSIPSLSTTSIGWTPGAERRWNFPPSTSAGTR